MLDLQEDQSAAAPHRITGRVVITDVRIKFNSLVWLLVKITFAAIPAVIIVAILSAFFWIALTAVVTKMR